MRAFFFDFQKLKSLTSFLNHIIDKREKIVGIAKQSVGSMVKRIECRKRGLFWSRSDETFFETLIFDYEMFQKKRSHFTLGWSHLTLKKFFHFAKLTISFRPKWKWSVSHKRINFFFEVFASLVRRDIGRDFAKFLWNVSKKEVSLHSWVVSLDMEKFFSLC